MGVFSSKNKNQLIKMQNLIFNDNSTKLYCDIQLLVELSNEKCQKVLEDTNQNVSIINSTIIPASFFDGYDTVITNLNFLITFDGYVKFSGNSLKDEINNLESIRDEQTQKMIYRVLINACDLISTMPIFDQQKAYDVFYNLFDGYFSRLTPKHLSYLENECKDKIFETVKINICNKESFCNDKDPRTLAIAQTVFGYQSFEDNIDTNNMDPLLNEAIGFVVESGQVSISMLQRQLKIGYLRAEKLLDDMEQMDIIESNDGSTFRKVKITYSEWENKYIIKESNFLEKNKSLEKQQLISRFERACDNSQICEDKIIKSKTGINVDYEKDGFYLDKLDNFIIPKSNNEIQILFINHLIKYATSSTIKLLLIDEDEAFNRYKGIPHLLIPIVTDKTKNISALKWLLSEMKKRQNTFVEYNCKGIDSYNKLILENQEQVNQNKPKIKVNGYSVPNEKMAHIIFVVNEFYNNKSDIEIDDYLIPLLLNGKRFGIHIFLFSKFTIKNLSLGIKADLLKVGDEEDLLDIFTNSNHINRTISLDKIDNEMDGYQFEKLCGELLYSNGFSKIKVTQSSADYGADIIAYKDEIKYAIQCKKYSSPVGVSAIQEVIASKSIYNCHVAVVLSNNYFTNNAVKLAEKNGVLLWGREKLVSFIKKANSAID